MSKRTRLLSRRQFLGQASCAAVGSTALFSTLLNLRMANSAAAQTVPGVPGDYKALVCLFFAGGIDSFNLLVPRGTSEYAEYRSIRTDLALADTLLLPINPLVSPGKELGLHPGLTHLQSLFEAGNAAWVSNVGTLVYPTTLAEYESESVTLPLGLFSHSDQIKQWQTSVPQSSGAIGWGGRTADLLYSLNNNDKISMNISLAGSNVWQTGNQVVNYTITENGSTARSGYDYTWGIHPARGNAIDHQLDIEYQNLFERTFVRTSRDAIDAHLEFSAAIENAPTFDTEFANVADNNWLADDLQMVARTIAAHNALGMTRQTFFVQVGGWDHHDEVINNMGGMVPLVSEAVGAFYDAMVTAGEQNNVTLFTASDFARTLTSNGQGSDHAWGGNHFVVGGAVNGQRVYGTYPDLFEGNNLDTGRGRLIPTTSVDEYFAELALWFGVSPGELATVLPNVTNFYTPGVTPPLGFMATA